MWTIFPKLKHLVLLLFVLAVFTGCLITKKPGTLIISSEPEGALVLVDDNHKGYSDTKNPLSFSLEQGTHRIRLFFNGYKPVNRSIFLPAGDTIHANFTLEPVEDEGYLDITCNIADAHI